jgi:hypothetical protein
LPDDNFGLKDADFWGDPLQPASSIPDDGLYLAAPSAVGLSKRDTLPLVVRRAGLMRDLSSLPFPQRAILTAVDLESNRLYANFALDTDNEAEEVFTVQDLEEMGEGRMLQPYLLEARDRLNLPWQPAQLMVSVILRDKITNRRKVGLGAEPGAYEDPAIAEFIEKRRLKSSPLPPWPPAAGGGELPAYGRMDGSPKVPDKPGIVISGDRVTLWEKYASCRLYGAAKVTILKSDLVNDKDRPERAVVNVHLLLTGADDPTPLTATLRVPIFEQVEPGKAVPVYFAVDLLELFNLPRETTTYFLYAFSREAFAGSSPFAFVTKDRLPPGA